MIYDCSDRIALSTAFSFFENKKLIDLLNVAESNIAKTKERSRKFKNKKSTITRKEKKAVKFIKRDFSKFKHIKREIQAKRVKKNFDKAIVSKTTVSKATRGREKQDRGKGKKGATTTISRFSTSIVTRFDNNVTRFIILFSNIESS